MFKVFVLKRKNKRERKKSFNKQNNFVKSKGLSEIVFNYVVFEKLFSRKKKKKKKNVLNNFET